MSAVLILGVDAHGRTQRILRHLIGLPPTRPTAFDHRQAEMRGLTLCVDCGKELTNPQPSRLCGRCEEQKGGTA